MKISVLSLATLRQNDTYRDAIEAMVRLAKKCEALGYSRFWIAEHHNTPYTASSATPLLIQQVLSQTTHIRVGSGGIMLPNHSPYVVAEQFGMLETLYPGRIDLGLGRAPGTDQRTSMALRRYTGGREASFPEDIREIQGYFKGTNLVHAYPAKGLDVPIYILGSSLTSAHLAAKLGLPYAFASHFAPAMLEEAVEIYRTEFKPSAVLSESYVIVGVNVIMADTQAEAERLSTTQLQAFVNIVTGKSQGLMPPVASDKEVWAKLQAAKRAPHFGPVKFEEDKLIRHEKEIVEDMFSMKLVGDKAEVKKQLQTLQERVTFEELITVSYIYDEEAHHHSHALFAEVVKDINA